MMTQSWLYDLIIYIYALSLLFYFADFLGRNPRAKRIGTGLLVFVWVLMTEFIMEKMMHKSDVSFFSMYGSLFFFSWLLVTISLMLNFILRIDLVLFLINLLGFAITALNFYSDEAVSPALAEWGVHDEVLFIHMSIAIAAYVCFFVAALFSAMHLFVYRKLKGKKWSVFVQRFPSLGNLQKYASRSVIVGVPLLLLSLTLGLVWVILEQKWMLFLDVKVLNSFLLLAMYGLYLWFEHRGKHAWPQLAKMNLVMFALVVFNFAAANWLSGFHQWIWK